MELFKKRLPLLFLVVIVYGFYFFTHLPSQSQAPAVLGTQKTVALFTEPIDGRSPIIEALDSAKKQILVEVYLLSDKQIIDSLIAARKRGVTVDVMLEEHPFGGGSLNQKTKKTLEDGNIAFEWTNSTFTLTHEKGIVVDQTESFVMNQNLTASAFSKNREYDIIDYDSKDILEQEQIFAADWDRKSVTLPANSHLVVSPVNSRSTLTTLLNSAKTSIDIEAEEINDPQIMTLLEDKAKIVATRIILPTLSQLNSNKPTITEFKSKGISVKVLSSPYIHAKLILEDGNKAYVGSINLSAQSMDQNRELGILLAQQNILESLSTTFENDWNKAKNP